MLRQGRERVDSRLLYDEMGLPGLPDKEQVPEIVEKFLLWDAATEERMKQTAEEHAIRYASRKSPSVLSSYSMNLPFPSPGIKQD